ncbi:MAG: transporter substrate-binding domain-containing protein [Pseudomonadota bacterium]
MAYGSDVVRLCRVALAAAALWALAGVFALATQESPAPASRAAADGSAEAEASDTSGAGDAPAAGGTAADDTDATADDGTVVVDFLNQPVEGDLDTILERGFLRIGTIYDPLFFAYNGADEYGAVADLAKELAKHLKSKFGKAARTLTVVPIPMPRGELLDALDEGRVELVAANLTITPERAGRVAFTDPMIKEVREVVVTGPELDDLSSLDDLVETGLHLRASSSYAEHLAALNAERTEAGKAPIPTTAVDERLQDHDLLELVAAGVVPAVPVDDHKAALWAQVFEGLVIHEGLALNEGGEVAWAVKQDRPKLLEALNGFVASAKKGTELGNIIFNRYLGDPERIANALGAEPTARLREVLGFIREFAAAYDFEPLMIAAQGFQESRLDQSKRSSAGAVGIMQLLPSTARDKNVNIPDISTAEKNVEAGVKYLRFLRDRYFSEEGVAPEDRVFMSLAAYNAGPGNIRKARARAEKMGLDPDVWFDNVEIATARVVSREPVIYVRNILKYYTSYTLYRELAEADADAAPQSE